MAFNLKTLEPLTGLWKGEGEIAPNPWGGAGPCPGRWSFRFDDAGKNLIHDYEESRHDGAGFNGHGVFCSEGDDLLWFWFDTYGFAPTSPSHGIWQKDLLILTRLTPRGIGRSTFRFAGEDMQYLIESRAAGEPGFSVVMRGCYAKI